MKLAALAILICIVVALLLLFIAAMALSATRRARLRGESKGELDFSDSETVQFTRDALEARRQRRESEDEDASL